MTRVEAEGIAVLWEDLLQRSPLPPRVAGVTGAEYELARLWTETDGSRWRCWLGS